MILLDTNVVSEIMKRQPDPHAASFIDAQPIGRLFVPSLVMAELRHGIARLPDGRRRAGIESDFEAFCSVGFASRILSFDDSCASGYARARGAREQAGRPVAVLDALIGGMALAHGATLATRNVADFDGYGLVLVDPWAAP
ncbi:MAG: type II toxin-antitoxin system VapC family toxin [Janthinobacterium lividum]